MDAICKALDMNIEENGAWSFDALGGLNLGSLISDIYQKRTYRNTNMDVPIQV